MCPAPLTFSALLRGERFRLIEPDGSLRPDIYTKVAGSVCKAEDGQWFDIKPASRVEPISPEAK